MNRAVLVVLAVAGIGLGMADAMIFGVGPMIGEPVGLSATLWPGRKGLALDAGLGYSWWQDSSVQVQGDMLMLSRELTAHPYEDGVMAFYAGVGAQMRLAGELKNPVVRTGLRMPLGMVYFLPPRGLICLYAEIVPIFNLGTTDQYFGGNGEFGFRFTWVSGG